ncbi:transporter substrate-binding domain-containing protein [Butyrivibrio sp. XPD2002]|uniref:transporter substrate-binding domain-containing protein n=1 Tax=Butyrivibrio sp. XPD2002 TaxID=1280665 RepID=UPI0003F90515|nr:transporter substrate-binding domain-containing protein [Butyrivibrio sp. XPD2002]
MKKLSSITLVLTMILTMCACGAKKDEGGSGSVNSEAVSSETASSEAVSSEANDEAASNETVSNEATDEAISKDEANADSEQTEASSEEGKIYKDGVLTMLNMTEDEMDKYRQTWKYVEHQLGREGYTKRNVEPFTGKREIIYYDTLDSMLMALNAGDIDEMMIYNKTGQYLCATNDNLQLAYTIDLEKERNTFANLVLSGLMSNDFAFLMMEGNETLRDEFSNAINDMKDDGTLDKLISEQIDTLINRSEVKPVTMPTIDSADTIKVAVTGALPPMDYVAADGTPAGFNTAVLAEISQRIGKNIELVVVDSIGRATALSSGTVDAVFWTRTNEMASKSKEVSDDERSSKIPEVESKMSDEEVEAFHNVRELFNFSEYSTVDMPEGTICTVPYYSDTIVLVMKK